MRAKHALAAFAAAALTLSVHAADAPLTLTGTIELPRVDGRIDHLAFDTVSGRLYIAALGNNTVEVVDVAAGTHVKSLPGFREPQGIAILGDTKTVAIANGQGEGLQLVRVDDSRPAAMIRLGDDADNVRYDSASKRVFVGYGSGALAAIDAAAGKVVGEARLAGHPESFQLERSGPRAFVNVPTAGQIAVVDRQAMKVTASWTVATAKANYPMALDEANHRLFVGCRNPARALVFDTATGQQVGAFEIVGDTDDMFYDAARKRLYVSGGEGSIDVIQDQGGNRFSRLARIPTAAGARTSLFVPEQGRLYLAVPHRGAQKAEIRVYAAP